MDSLELILGTGAFCIMALAIVLPLKMYLGKRANSRKLLAQLKKAAELLGFTDCDNSLWHNNTTLLLQDVTVIEGMSNTQTKGQAKYYYALSAKDGDDTYFVPVFVFEVPKHLPHIVIISTLNQEMAPPISRMLPDSSHQYKAEGLFGDVFDSFFISGSQSHALSLFSPDIMEKLVRQFSDCSFEVINKRFYIIAPTTRSRDFDGLLWLNSANDLASEIYKNSSGRHQPISVQSTNDDNARIKVGLSKRHILSIQLFSLTFIYFVAVWLFEISGYQSWYGLVFFSLIAFGILTPFIYALKRNDTRKRISDWVKHR